MIKSDFHTHTIFSDDCNTPFDEAVSAAIKQGIEHFAVTDHYDPGFPNPDFSFDPDFDSYFAAMNRVREQYASSPDFTFAAGIEVGIREGETDRINNTLSMFDFDVVIGSFHCYRDIDISTFDFRLTDRNKFLSDFYEYMYRMLSKYTNYDILGHLTVLDRYAGEDLSLDPCSEIIDEILKLQINNGKSVEINSSSFNYRMGVSLPRRQILERYRQLGGEMITFGSDAHNPAHYRSHFDDSLELAKAIGFKYHCTYKNREPIFNSL